MNYAVYTSNYRNPLFFSPFFTTTSIYYTIFLWSFPRFVFVKHTIEGITVQREHKTTNKYKKLCPECKGNLFEHNNSKQEITCRKCGLVLYAPACSGFVFPGYYLFPRHHKRKIIVDSPLFATNLVINVLIHF